MSPVIIGLLLGLVAAEVLEWRGLRREHHRRMAERMHVRPFVYTRRRR